MAPCSVHVAIKNKLSTVNLKTMTSGCEFLQPENHFVISNSADSGNISLKYLA